MYELINSNIKVIVDDSGINEFTKLIKEKKFDKESIGKLFDFCTPYKKLVEVGGPNIGIFSKEEWINIFYEALNSSDERGREISAEDIDNYIKYNIYKTVVNTSSNIDEFEKISNKVIEEIKTARFIDIAKQFIPNQSNLDQVTINVLLFMDNAFGVKDQMILDAQLLGKLGMEAIPAALAHELHHMLREKYVKEYKVNKKYKVISQILHWLENEGIADMCNLHITGRIFEDIGFLEKGRLEFIFNNIDDYLSKINDLFLNILKDVPYDEEFYKLFERESAYHAVGNTMARRIMEIAGIEGLKKCVGDNLKFILTYQECAKKLDSIYCFDEKVIKGLKSIYKIKDQIL